MAKVIKDSLDETVDPCQDFYQFTCGNWANNNEIPEGETSWDLWHMVQKKITDSVLDIITSETKPDDILAVKLTKKWYNVCIDTDKIEEAGLEPLLNTMARIGGWPLIMDPDEWDDRMYPWQKVDDYYTRIAGMPAFFDIRIVDFLSDDIRLAIIPPHFPPRSYRLWNGDSGDDGDDSNENESEEKDNEPGSEQEDNDEDEEDDEDDDTDEDENENKVARRTKKLSSRKISKKTTHVRRKLKKGKSTTKQHGEKKSKRRIKRRVTSHAKKVSHTEKQRRQKKVHSQHAKRIAMKTPKHRRLTDNEEETPENTPEGNDENENESTNDIDDNNSKNEDEGEESEGKDEDGEEGSNNENEGEDEEDEDEGEDEEEEDDDGSTEESTEQNREIYKKYILDVAQALAEARSVELSEEKLKKDIEDMLAFHVKLIELTYEDEMRYDFDNMTLNEFQEAYNAHNPKSRGKVSWLKKFQRMFNEASIEITGDEDAFVACNKYMEGLASLLDETPAETIVNYIHWNYVSKLLITTTKKMTELFDNWTTNGKSKEEDRAEQCVQQIEMQDVVAYKYVQKHFSGKIKTLALDMIDDIQKEVEYQIKEASWMNEETKDFILDKLVYMKRLVGYPDWYENSTIVRKYFRGLTVGPSYYENVLSYIRYVNWKKLRTYVDQPEVDEWFISPMVLNAFFMPTENSITVTAADFQNPFFAVNRPQSINYGIVGSIMAHEVNHGFDDSGHLYDKSGKAVEWLSAMAAAYNKRAECFVDQFNKYSILESTNLTIEDYGNQTAGENIADTMGLQSVFRAYQRRQRECGKVDPLLPGLEKYTNEQLFFLSFANVWCEAIADPEEAALRAKFDVHSPGRLRVIGSVSNSEDFAKAFNCPVGSPMNPKKKCNIWV